MGGVWSGCGYQKLLSLPEYDDYMINTVFSINNRLEAIYYILFFNKKKS